MEELQTCRAAPLKNKKGEEQIGRHFYTRVTA
jgi:hypothetical protein